MSRGGKTVRMDCGCVHELHGERWTQLCATHEAEFNETHDRWARERITRVVTGTGNAAERRELDALCRGLRSQP